MKFLTTIALLLVIVGGLNWLLVGLFHFNLVHFRYVGMAGKPCLYYRWYCNTLLLALIKKAQPFSM